MRVIRSFPAHVPLGRSYVVDDAERHLNEDYSYRGLVDFDDNLIHLDWDMAVSREDLQRFAARAQENPDRVLVGPQRVDVGSRAGLHQPVWNMRAYAGDRLRHVHDGEPECDLYGFGMVYLPWKLLTAFEQAFAPELDDDSVRFDDTGFAGWSSKRYGRAAIDWTVHPVHLHYRISEVIL